MSFIALNQQFFVIGDLLRYLIGFKLWGIGFWKFVPDQMKNIILHKVTCTQDGIEIMLDRMKQR